MSHIGPTFNPRDHVSSISSIKSTPTQYYTSYQNKYTTTAKPYAASNYAAANNNFQYSNQKLTSTLPGMSTDKKTKSPIEDMPDPTLGTQLLQKNFSTTSISSAPYSTARLTGMDHLKTYGGGMAGMNAMPVEEVNIGDLGNKEGNKIMKQADEVPPEPRPIPNILPIKYTQPA